MIGFEQFLIDKGYQTYQSVSKINWNKDAKKEAQKILDKNINDVIFIEGDRDSDESHFLIPSAYNHVYTYANYNVMKNGGSRILFIKDLKYKESISFGLSEFGQPPTLLYPRPNFIVFEKQIKNNTPMDYELNLILKYIENEKIFEAMFDKSIILELSI